MYKFGLQIHVSTFLLELLMADQRFSFVSDKEVAETRGKRVPVTTQRHTLWSRNVFEEWAKARNNEFRDFRQESKVYLCPKYRRRHGQRGGRLQITPAVQQR